jgi:hypothetical protein
MERVADLYRVHPEGLIRAYAMRYAARRPAIGETRSHYLELVDSLEQLLSALDRLHVR